MFSSSIYILSMFMTLILELENASNLLESNSSRKLGLYGSAIFPIGTLLAFAAHYKSHIHISGQMTDL